MIFRRAGICLIFVLAFSDPLPAQDSDSAVLEVHVDGIKDIPGEIGVALFNAKLGYPIHIEHAYENEWIPLKKGLQAVDAVFDGIPPGEYAVSVVHDTNANRSVDRSTVGFPKEGVGFSNGQKVTLRAPRYEKSKIMIEGGKSTKIVITLDYRD